MSPNRIPEGPGGSPERHGSISETVPPGWNLTSIVCDDTDSTGDLDTETATFSDGNSSGDLNTGTATFNVEPGESVTCVFTNTPQTPPALPPWGLALLALLLAATGLAAARAAGGRGLG